MMTATKTRRSPENIWIGTGAVRQHEGKLPLYLCNTCGAEVVWVEGKTGRKYLANVSHGYNDARFYIGANIHDCAPALARREEHEWREERDHHFAYLFFLSDQHDAGEHTAPVAMCHICERAAR